jgi:hypothetical protein
MSTIVDLLLIAVYGVVVSILCAVGLLLLLGLALG